jgi:hypothetical protein
MAAYSFKRQFVEPIRAGTKRHTIRADRKDGRVPKVGEPLALYCGMRTKGCFKILDVNPPCTMVQRVYMSDQQGWLLYSPSLEAHIRRPKITIEECMLSLDECEQLARSDGFPDFATMMAFWNGRLPFTGNIIHWNPEARA